MTNFTTAPVGRIPLPAFEPILRRSAGRWLLLVSIVAGILPAQVHAEERVCRMSGLVQLDDVARLRNAFSQGCTRIVLNSSGGDAEAAVEIGQMIRRAEATVVVPTGGQCTSACVFMYAGGVQRHNSGTIAIHRPYLARLVVESFSATQARYRALERVARAFLREANVSEALYEQMMQVRPENARRLDAQELEGLGLAPIDPVWQENMDNRNALRLGLDRHAFMEAKSAAVRNCGPIEGMAFSPEQAAFMEACWKRTFPGFLR